MINGSDELMDSYPTIADLRSRARQRIPFLSWEYLESGTGDELAITRNVVELQKIVLPPAIMKGEFEVNLGVEILGRQYDAPFGIAPVGLTGLMWPGAEYQLAKTALKYRIPYCLSTVATQTPEEIGTLSGDMGWFQLYPPREPEIRRDLLMRAKTNGFDTLVVTADVPIPSRRERTKRAGLRMPPRTTVKMIVDALRHPAWTRGILKHGSPRLKTIEKYTQSNSRAAAAKYVNENLGGTLSWEYLGHLRTEWNGKLIVKGVLNAAAARKAVEMGADGIVVSNHGGRQFDASPAPINMLEGIANAVGGQAAIIFDSGIHSGLDVIRALSMGADFVMLGRGFLYGLAALGDVGSDHVCDILMDEMRNCMLQMGCATIAEIKNMRV